VATAIAHEAQHAVVVARYGGEEFAILLESADLASALELAQRISRAVVSLEIPHRHSRAANCVTLSLGVAAIEALTAARVATLVSEADAGLYAAKHQGRNRSVARRAGQIFAPI
jgi:diguanylate cyclase (GGDEF)-like protein